MQTTCREGSLHHDRAGWRGNPGRHDKRFSFSCIGKYCFIDIFDERFYVIRVGWVVRNFCISAACLLHVE